MCRPSAVAENHEAFVQRIARLSLAKLDPDDRAKVRAKIVYGLGLDARYRGVTVFSAWKNGEPKPIDLIEVCAHAEESLVQIAGTTVHEVGHALAGHKAAHGPAWKKACKKLGLRCVKASGMTYTLAAFAPDLREAIEAATIVDGKPVFGSASGLGLAPPQPRPCTVARGSRGGKSRGKGSGSRLRKYTCGCKTPVRVASDDWQAHCDKCGQQFKLSV